MYKQVRSDLTHEDKEWIDLCLEVANKADGIDGVIIGVSTTKFLFDPQSDSDPILVERNIQMQYAFSDITDRSWFGDDRIDLTQHEFSDNPLEYHNRTEEFVLNRPSSM